MTEYLPCHMLNVFIPLIDINEEEGPTEFRPQSQRLTLDLQKLYLRAFFNKTLQPTVRPLLKKGSILLVCQIYLHYLYIYLLVDFLFPNSIVS